MISTLDLPYRIFFGDASLPVEPKQLRGQSNTVQLAQTLANKIGMHELILQHQVHGGTGLAITPENRKLYSSLLTHDSDYLITNLPGIAIGVLTADCLPIALFDTTGPAIAMIHAGWRGSIANIAANALAHMQKLYGTKPANVRAFFGPSAGTCCYQVDQKFVEQLPAAARAFVTTDSKRLIFDNPEYNAHILIQAGVPAGNIDRTQHACTICNTKFCSYRRNSGLSVRQISIIGLNFCRQAT